MYVKVTTYIKNKIVRATRMLISLFCNILQIYLGFKLKPKAIYIEPTNICNANCIFCAYQFYDAKKEIMRNETLEIILKEVKLLKIKYVNLTPFAGEILMDKKIVEKIKLLKANGINNISAYTNLLNLHNVGIDSFLEAGISNLLISTAPLKKELYEEIYRVKKYDIFLNNLILFLKKFNSNKKKTIKKLSIEFRSDRSLYECLELNDYKIYIEPLISKDINISVMTEYDSWMGFITKRDLVEGMEIKSADFKKPVPCQRLNNVQILSNGDIRVCGCRFNNKSNNDIFNIGNISKVTIFEAYNSDKVKKLKKTFLKGNPPEECQKCSWYNL